MIAMILEEIGKDIIFTMIIYFSVYSTYLLSLPVKDGVVFQLMLKMLSKWDINQFKAIIDIGQYSTSFTSLLQISWSFKPLQV